MKVDPGRVLKYNFLKGDQGCDLTLENLSPASLRSASLCILKERSRLHFLPILHPNHEHSNIRLTNTDTCSHSSYVTRLSLLSSNTPQSTHPPYPTATSSFIHHGLSPRCRRHLRPHPLQHPTLPRPKKKKKLEPTAPSSRDQPRDPGSDRRFSPSHQHRRAAELQSKAQARAKTQAAALGNA